MESEKLFMRRNEAAAYLVARYGFGCKKVLEKAACVGGGPAFRKVGRLTVYERTELDKWALSKMSPPMLSTSDTGAQAA